MDLLLTDAWATAYATADNTNLPAFWVHWFGGVPPTTSAQLAAALSTPGPLITFKNQASNGGSYALNWVSPGTNSRLLTRDPTQVAVGTGLTAAGTGTQATWFVIAAPGDTLGASSSALRLMGTIGSGGDVNLISQNTLIVQGTAQYLAPDFNLTY